MIRSTQKRLIQGIAYSGLGLVILPSLFYFRGDLQLEDLENMMLVGTAIWFGASFLSRPVKKL